MLPQISELEPFIDARGYLREDVSQDSLRALLLHHFVAQTVKPSGLQQRDVLETALDDHPLVVADAQVAVRDAGGGTAYFTTGRIEAGRSVIIFVDAVLVPRRHIADAIRDRSPDFATALECAYPYGFSQAVTILAPPDTIFSDENIDSADIARCANPARLEKIVNMYVLRERLDTVRLQKAPFRSVGERSLEMRQTSAGYAIADASGRVLHLEDANIQTEEGVVHELSGGF